MKGPVATFSDLISLQANQHFHLLLFEFSYWYARCVVLPVFDISEMVANFKLKTTELQNTEALPYVSWTSDKIICVCCQTLNGVFSPIWWNDGIQSHFSWNYVVTVYDGKRFKQLLTVAGYQVALLVERSAHAIRPVSTCNNVSWKIASLRSQYVVEE